MTSRSKPENLNILCVRCQLQAYLDAARLDGKIFTEEDIRSIKCKMDMTMILYEAGPDNECLPVADVLKLASPEPAE